MVTAYHAKYFAHDLQRQCSGEDSDRLSLSLFDACVDLNPHQIEAALYAFRSPLSKGVMLADEVGLGKTIEAGLVLCQYWAERKRKILVICPASLRRQWADELAEKFNLPSIIIDAKSYRQEQQRGNLNPFEQDKVVICSFHYASRKRGDIRAVDWDTAAIDEAHKLRNCYRSSNVMGQNILWALEDRHKLLLTATPLQNSLMELYGLSCLVDQSIFGDTVAFRTLYTGQDADLDGLRTRLASFCKRTLRRQVSEYISYTERIPVVFRFRPTENEQRLYEAVSEFLLREDTYSLPAKQRNLTILILRKILASSSRAIAATLETMRDRLKALQNDVTRKRDLWNLISDESELEDDVLEELLAAEENGEYQGGEMVEEDQVDPVKLQAEIDELEQYICWARSIGVDSKTKALLTALENGFLRMEEMGAPRKTLIFTESRRTQTYLKEFLQAHGYTGKVLTFNGTNTDPESREVYEKWLMRNEETGRASGSKPVDRRLAIIDTFRNEAEIMIATEAAAEGVNLQFCSMVINYDLPWNPQRIEQRIGRCHRYGQKFDVVVMNFLNERNAADMRVYQLLNDKFNLFSGIFGASDEVLGNLESGLDFEKRILNIYQRCRTSAEIESAFNELQQEMEASIAERMADTRKILLEHFDEDVHSRLKGQLDETKRRLDQVSDRFWRLTQFILGDHAQFNDDLLTFRLHDPPSPAAEKGTYHLISKERENITGRFLYRPSHPLGEFVLEQGRLIPTPPALVKFNISNHPTRISVVEKLKGKSGWLTCNRLQVDSFESEEHLLFSAFTDSGDPIPPEVAERFFACNASTAPLDEIPTEIQAKIKTETEQHSKAMVHTVMERSNRQFNEQREKLDKWADDMVLAAEKDMKDTKNRIRMLRREARKAVSVEEQHKVQKQLQAEEKKLRRQRRDIFDLEDEVADKRDMLIEKLEKRMHKRTRTEPLFTIHWKIV